MSTVVKVQTKRKGKPKPKAKNKGKPKQKVMRYGDDVSVSRRLRVMEKRQNGGMSNAEMRMCQQAVVGLMRNPFCTNPDRGTLWSQFCGMGGKRGQLFSATRHITYTTSANQTYITSAFTMNGTAGATLPVRLSYTTNNTDAIGAPASGGTSNTTWVNQSAIDTNFGASRIFAGGIRTTIRFPLTSPPGRYNEVTMPTTPSISSFESQTFAGMINAPFARVDVAPTMVSTGCNTYVSLFIPEASEAVEYTSSIPGSALAANRPTPCVLTDGWPANTVVFQEIVYLCEGLAGVADTFSGTQPSGTATMPWTTTKFFENLGPAIRTLVDLTGSYVGARQRALGRSPYSYVPRLT
jgi:hypothetical protein